MVENMDSKIPPDPTAAGGFPNSSDTNEDDEDEPVAAAVVDEEKEEEEDDAGMEDPSIASNNRTRTLTEKRDFERRGRRNRKEKWALNKALKWYDPGLRALRMGRSRPFVRRTAAKGCVPRVRERRRKSGAWAWAWARLGIRGAYLKLWRWGPAHVAVLIGGVHWKLGYGRRVQSLSRRAGRRTLGR